VSAITPVASPARVGTAEEDVMHVRRASPATATNAIDSGPIAAVSRGDGVRTGSNLASVAASD
jgi:hypothetical protein